MPERGDRSPFLENPPGEDEEGLVLKILENAARMGKGQVVDGTIPPLSFKLKTIPPSVKEKLEEVLLSPDPRMAFVYLKQTNFLKNYLPEIEALSAFGDSEGEHKNLWEHTLQVVYQVKADKILRWSALFHDIGKVKTKTVDSDCQVHFWNHEVVGAKMASAIMKRLGFSKDEARKIRFLVFNHHRCSQYSPQWTDSAVRRLGRQMGENFEELVLLSKADITTKKKYRREKYLRYLSQLVGRLRKIRQQDSKPPPLPSGLGNYIMREFNLKPGPKVGEMKKFLLKLIEEKKITEGMNHRYYLEVLRNSFAGFDGKNRR